MRAFTLRVACACLLSGLALQAQAIPLSLDTTWLDANAKLSLTPMAQQTLALTGISVSASGKTSDLGRGAYNLPVSGLKVNVGLLPPSLDLIKADALGAGLTFASATTHASATLNNLSLNYQSGVIEADLLSAGVSTHLSVFSFDVVKPLSLSLTNGVSVNLNLGNIRLTQSGAASFASALHIPSVLVPTFMAINFGTLDAKVVPWLRTPVPSVPEPALAWLWALGGAAMAGVVRARRLRGAA